MCAMHSGWFSLDILHISTTFTASVIHNRQSKEVHINLYKVNKKKETMCNVVIVVIIVNIYLECALPDADSGENETSNN